MIAITPVMFTLHRRWGLAVPAVMAVAATGVDTAVVGYRVPFIGFANFLLVWGAIHQWGFAWRTGALTRPRWRPLALAVGGTALVAVLLGPGPFPVDMIGSGQRVNNTNPPSVALLSFAAAQTGLLLLAEPWAMRILARPRPWRWVRRLNPFVITVYLWHMTPVIVVAAAFYSHGLVPQPAVGTAAWWELRPAWFAVLTVVLIPLVLAVSWAERPLRHLPLRDTSNWSGATALLLAGLIAAAVGLARFAMGGFAPTGDPALPVLGVYLGGVALTVVSARATTRP